ncbi:MAG: DUF99 family protein [Thermoplasmata archaeon]|nr:DUF99 family protein [Thermoplasmata archaeon]
MKEGTRILGVDDGPFKFGDERTPLVGVLMRLPAYVERVVCSTAEVDGLDASERIIEMVGSRGIAGQAHLVLLDGAAVGGFNVVDCERIWKETGVPVATFTRDRPDPDSIRKVLSSRFSDWEERFRVVEKARVMEGTNGGHPVYLAVWGAGRDEVLGMIRRNTVRGATPEALRLAHIIARGVSPFINGR